MTAPGLHGDTVAVQPEGSKLNVRASGQGARGERLVLEEFLNFPEGSDLSGASAAYENDQVLIRVPKSGLKHSAG